MGKYLMLWEVNLAKAPEDVKERGAGYAMLMSMVKQDMQKGIIKDWAAFVGETNGYSVVEGTEAEIGKMVQQYVPFVTFKSHAAASFSQVNEVVEAMQ